MVAKRIYVVTEFDGTEVVGETLVKATSQAQAIRGVAKGKFSASPAGSSTVADMMAAGHKVLEIEETTE